MAAYQHVRSAPARCGHRSPTARDLGAETTSGLDARSASAEPESSAAYGRLLAGETVSWQQIMEDNPVLGTITVAQLVNARVFHVIPDYDPITGTIDIRLCRRKR